MRPVSARRLLAATSVVAAFVAGCGSSSSPSSQLSTSSAPSSQLPAQSATPRVFPGQLLPSGAVTIHLPSVTGSGYGANELRSSSDGVWVSDGLFRIDPTDDAVAPGLDTKGADDDGYLAVDADSVWGTDYTFGEVRRFDPASGRLLATIGVDTAEGIATTPEGVWVASHHSGAVMYIDRSSNAVTQKVQLQPPGYNGPQGLAVGMGSVWVDVPNPLGTVFRLDAHTGAVQAQVQFPSVNPCGEIAVTQSSVWVVECDGTHVMRIDPATDTVAPPIDTKGNVDGIAADGDNVWFVTGGYFGGDEVPGYLEEMNNSGAVLRKIAMGTGFVTGGVVVAFNSIWVSALSAPVVVRIPR